MASRKMTFTIPQDLAIQFLLRVPARDRSRYVTEAIAARLPAREEQTIGALFPEDLQAVEQGLRELLEL